jgi:hypothetical protein
VNARFARATALAPPVVAGGKTRLATTAFNLDVANESGETLSVKCLASLGVCNVERWRVGRNQGRERAPEALLSAPRLRRGGVRDLCGGTSN